MLKDIYIRKLADFILLNAYSVNSTGFYNGKAGAALCLFEVSRMLKDDYIENHAYDILQESLISKNEDISFENGLSGIGFVLNYLIESKFLDADFEELFGQNLTKIIKVIENEKSQEDEMTRYLTCVYLLHPLSFNKNYDGITKLINKTIDSVYIYLNKKINEFESIQSPLSKFNLLKVYEVFLKIITRCDNIDISLGLLQKYSDLYLKSKIISDFSVGHYMKIVASKTFCDSQVVNISKKNMMSASQNIYPDTLLLSEQINLLFLLHQYGDLYSDKIKELETPFNESTNKKIEENILKKINSKTIVFGYESGVSRFLLYQVFMQNKNNGVNTSRFNYLFN